MPDSISVIDTIIQDSATFLTQSSTAEAAAKENLIKASNVQQEISDLYRGAAEDAGAVKKQEALAALNSQRATLRAANAAGVNPMAAADVITELLSKTAESSKVINENVQKYYDLEGVSFTDNPIQWLQNRFFEMPKVAKKVNQEIQRSDILNTQLATVNKNITDVARTQEHLKESITAASAESLSRLVSTEAQIKARQAAIEGWKYNTLSIEAAANASKDRLTALYNIQNALRGEQQMAMSMMQFDQHLKEFDWRREEKRIADEAKASQQDLEGYTIERINVGRSNRGLPAIDGRDAKRMIQILKSGGAGAKELESDFARGEASLVTGISIIGASPAESANVIMTSKTALPEHRQGVGQLLAEGYNAAANNKMAQKPEEKLAVINEYVNTRIADQFRSIRAGSGNLFDIGDLASYIQLSGVQDLPIVTQLLKPAADNKQPLNDPKLVLALANDAVLKGTITSTQAQDLAIVYQKANEVNQAARGFTGFGIQIPMNGKAYMANLGFASGTVNLTDSTAIGHFLAKDLAARVRTGSDRRGSETRKLTNERMRNMYNESGQ